MRYCEACRKLWQAACLPHSLLILLYPPRFSKRTLPWNVLTLVLRALGAVGHKEKAWHAGRPSMSQRRWMLPGAPLTRKQAGTRTEALSQGCGGHGSLGAACSDPSQGSWQPEWHCGWTPGSSIERPQEDRRPSALLG